MCVKYEFMHVKIHIKLSQTKSYAQPSFSIWLQFFSAKLKEREAKAMGRSVPSGNWCDNTAPMSYGLASHSSIKGNSGSKWTKTVDDAN